MKYQLICTGRMLDGVEKDQALAEIKRITRLSEERIERELLSGRPKKLISSTDEEKITRLSHALRNAGLDVEVKTSGDVSAWRPYQQQDAEPPEGVVTDSALGPSFRWQRWLLTSFLLLLLSMAGASGYAWYWLQQPLPAAVDVAEKALFDDSLVAIGLIDVEKLVVLERYWFGDVDPHALPVDETRRGVLKEAFYRSRPLQGKS